MASYESKYFIVSLLTVLEHLLVIFMMEHGNWKAGIVWGKSGELTSDLQLQREGLRDQVHCALLKPQVLSPLTRSYLSILPKQLQITGDQE